MEYSIIKLLSEVISIKMPKMEKEVCVGNIMIRIGVNQDGNK